MPQLDLNSYLTQILWLAIVFPLLYIFIAKFFSPTLDEVISSRKNKIENDIAEAERMLEKHKKLKSEISTILANARSIALSVKEEVLSDAKSLMESELRKFDDDLAKKSFEEEKRLEILHLQLKSQLPHVAKDLGHSIFNKILKEFNDQINLTH